MDEKILLDNKALPCKILLAIPKEEARHIHKDLSFVYAIRGTILLDIAGRTVTLNEGETEVINSFEPHQFLECAPDSQILRMEINLEHYYSLYPKLKGKYFSLKDNGATDKELDRLITLGGRIIMEAVNQDQEYLLNIFSCLNEVVILLAEKFSCKNMHDMLNRDNNSERHVMELCNYLDQHYNEDWTLPKLARRTSLTDGYFTRIFKNITGLPPLKYLNTIRINKSISDIINTRSSIETVAEKFGFTNTKAYNRAFQSVYGMSPAHYRKMSRDSKQQNKKASFYANDEIRTALEHIVQSGEGFNIEYRAIQVRTDAAGTGTILQKPWKRMCGFQNVRDCVMSDWHEQLQTVQRSLGFQYVLCRNVFTKEMQVVSHAGRHKTYNFQKLDRLFDFLDSLGLKPLIEFCFTPLEDEHFTDKTEKFQKDASDKEELLTVFLMHIMSRYGREKVLSWRFSICGTYALRTSYGKIGYHEMFVRLFQVLKNVEQELVVGTAGFNWHFLPEEELKTFFSYLSRHHVKPDFLSFRLSYIRPKTAPPFERCDDYCEYMAGKTKLITNYEHTPPNYAYRVAHTYRKLLDEFGFATTKLVITDFGAAGVKDMVNDTCFKGAYLVKNMLDLSNVVDMVSYGSFTDLTSTQKENSAVFHGGPGLFTLNGARKSVFNAYMLLNKLGDWVLAQGDGYIVTKGADESLRILVYNYCHYDDQATSLFAYGTDTEDIYSLFEKKKRKVFEFKISGLEGTFFEKVYRVNQDNGSAFESCMGGRAFRYFDRNDMKLFNATSIPAFSTAVKTYEKEARIQISVKPHEIVELEILPKIYN